LIPLPANHKINSSLDSKPTSKNSNRYACTSISTNWGPSAFKLSSLLGLLCLTLCYLIGIVVLNTFSESKKLLQPIFVTEAGLPYFKSIPMKFAPISIIPTIFAIGISLWWSMIQEAVCQLSPHILLSNSRGTSLRKTLQLCYNPMNWPLLSIDALNNRHWSLLALVIGSLLGQIRK